MKNSLLDMYQDLLGKGVIFCFCGVVTQEMTEAIGGAVRSHIDREIGEPNVTLRVFSVFIEMVQNITRYAKGDDEAVKVRKEEGEGLIVVGREDAGYYIRCGNIITASERPELERKLTTIRGMSKDELKALYREQRRRGPDEASKGANLGFIEIARKATGFDFAFHPMGGDDLFFALDASV